MTIPTLSPTPVRGDPDTFSTAFETFLSGLDPWAVAVQAVGDAADADATAAAASAATATTQAGLATTNGAAQVALATTQANNAANSATASANSALVAGAVAWVSGTTYAIGDTRYSPINFQTYRRKTTGAGTTDPSADSTNWTAALDVLPTQTSNSGKFLTTNGTDARWDRLGLSISARTSDTVLGAADIGTLIDITSGTFTQTFAAATTLASGWWCYIRNSGTGNITLNPNASETIDGLASYILYPGECRLVQCNGTNLTSVVLNGSNYVEFLTSGTWTKPAGATWVYVEAIGGGASGAVSNSNIVCGGGGGGYNSRLMPASSVTATVSVAVGAGGEAVTTTSRNAGGNSTFGSYVTASGAPVGYGFYDGPAGGGESSGAAGTRTGGYSSGAGGSNAEGGSCVKGGAGGGGGNSARAGGVSTDGGNGGAGATSGTAVSGTVPGGGGGAVCNVTGTSGAGAAGRIRVWAW